MTSTMETERTEQNEEYVDEKIVTPARNIDELVEQLRKIFSHDRVNVDYVKAVLSSYKSNPAEWKKYAKFDPHRYTRNLVDAGNGKYNVMALCWNEAQGSSIHDHADAHCFVKVLHGELMETMFAWPDGSSEEQAMTKLSCNHYPKDGVAYINDDMGLHRVENPSHTETAVSLHIYIPAFKQCAIFDQKTGHKNSATMTFWSKYGERTPFEASCAVPENN